MIITEFSKVYYKSLIDLYPEISKALNENGFVFSLNKQMSIEDFYKISNLELTKVADCCYNTKENFPLRVKKDGTLYKKQREYINGPEYTGKTVDYIPIPGREKDWKTEAQEWVYFIVYAGKIVKIGMTSAGLASRFGSYNCGTKRAMLKGSCATIKLIITECNYLALVQGLDVEIYAYQIEERMIPTGIIIAGEELSARAQVAPAFESRLIDLYKEERGSLPPLCGQKGGK